MGLTWQPTNSQQTTPRGRNDCHTWFSLSTLHFFTVTLASTARSTHRSVSLNLVASALISSPISPPARNRYIEESSLPPVHPCLFAAKKFHWGLSFFPAILFASCRVFALYLYSSPDFNYLANLFNFHREWESENSRSFITAHTGG